MSARAAEEYREGRPFVGKAGKILREWFRSAELDFDNFRRWNVCIDYQPDNPPPLIWEIERDRAEVRADIVSCQPRVIAAVGVHAAEWCLGRKVKLADEHGREIEVQIGNHCPRIPPCLLGKHRGISSIAKQVFIRSL